MTRRFVTTLLAITLLSLAPLTVLADHGQPHEGEHCGRERPCTEVTAGEMSCMPAEGVANDFSVIVGSADSGEFKLEALGTTHPGAGACMFEIRIDTNSIRFNEGWTINQLAPHGGASQGAYTPCWATDGDQCTAVATFSWWRAAHGVTFDVPYALHVNGVLVDEGEVHYYDPPMVDELFGGPIVLH